MHLMALIEISRSRFKQSRNSMDITHFYFLGHFGLNLEIGRKMRKSEV